MSSVGSIPSIGRRDESELVLRASQPLISASQDVPSLGREGKNTHTFGTVSRQPSQVAPELYTPLLPWETRLLAIHPGHEDDELVAELLTVILTSDAGGVGHAIEKRVIEYEALSYTWGEPTFTEPLLCRGHTCFITPNLDAALRHLRQTDAKRYIWCDAICINQADIVEKADQISKLFTIFKKATRVIAWLGPEAESTKVGVKFLQDLMRQFPKLRENADLMWQSAVTEWLEQRGGCFFTEFGGILDLLQRPWCRRAWVVQEIFAANDISVHCGSIQLDWAHFIIGKEIIVDWSLSSGHNEFGSQPLGASTIHFLDGIRHQKRVQEQHALGHLLSLLERGASLMASDDRDRVFALVGIATELANRGRNRIDWQWTIPIDYTKSTCEVYEELTKRMINESASLEPLFTTTSNSGNENDVSRLPPISGLPSWCPDWRKVEVSHRVSFMEDHMRGKKDPKRYISQDLNARGVLCLRGFVLGEVSGFNDHEDSRAWRPSIRIQLTGRVLDNLSLPPKISVSDISSWEYNWLNSGQPKPGDICVCVRGGLSPIILRERPYGSSYTFVGHAFLAYDIAPSEKSMIAFKLGSMINYSLLYSDPPWKEFILR